MDVKFCAFVKVFEKVILLCKYLYECIFPMFLVLLIHSLIYIEWKIKDNRSLATVSYDSPGKCVKRDKRRTNLLLPHLILHIWIQLHDGNVGQAFKPVT